MKIFFKALLAGVAALSFATNVNAVLLTFDDATLPSYMSAGGRMTWNGTGGGHWFDEGFNSSSSFLFSTPTTINSFDLNGLPWEGWNTSENISDYLVQAFDSNSNVIWTDNIDLSSYGVGTWGSWLTVNIDTANVSELRFGPAGPSAWPSIDNMALNEPTNGVPAPSVLALMGLGLTGLGWSRRKKV